jgi:hypothetical protein
VGGGPEYKGGLNGTMAEVGALIDLTVVPWGNARISGDVWECQHGPGECMGNTIESCVMHLCELQQHARAKGVERVGLPGLTAAASCRPG